MLNGRATTSYKTFAIHIVSTVMRISFPESTPTNPIDMNTMESKNSPTIVEAMNLQACAKPLLPFCQYFILEITTLLENSLKKYAVRLAKVIRGAKPRIV